MKACPLGFRAAPKSLYTHDHSRLGISCLDLPGHFLEHPHRHERAPHRRATPHRRKRPRITAVVAFIRPISALYKHGCIFPCLCTKLPEMARFSRAESCIFGHGLRLRSSIMVFGLALRSVSPVLALTVKSDSYLLSALTFPILPLPALLPRSPHFISAFISALFNLSFSPISALSALTRRFPHLH